MPRTSRQLIVLALLLAALGTLVIVRFGGDSGTTTSGPVSSGSRASAPAPQRVPVSDVRLDLLKHRDDELVASARNPFRFVEKETPPSPAPSVAPRPINVAPVPTGPPPPPPIALKFIGLLDGPPRAGRYAILSDSRGGVFYGKEGDIIEGRYQVLKIGAESAELAYVDGRGRQTIRLSGQ